MNKKIKANLYIEIFFFLSFLYIPQYIYIYFFKKTYFYKDLMNILNDYLNILIQKVKKKNYTFSDIFIINNFIK